MLLLHSPKATFFWMEAISSGESRGLYTPNGSPLRREHRQYNYNQGTKYTTYFTHGPGWLEYVTYPIEKSLVLVAIIKMQPFSDICVLTSNIP